MRVRIHGKYLLVCQLFVQNNISCEKMEHLVTLKFHAFVTTYYQARYGLPHNSGLRKQNHCQTAKTYTTLWYLWPSGCFFRESKRWKSLGAMSQWLYDTPIQTVVTRLPLLGCGVLAPSGSCCWTSEKVSSWLQLPKSCWNAETWLTVIPFSKPRTLCCRYTWPDNAL